MSLLFSKSSQLWKCHRVSYFGYLDTQIQIPGLQPQRFLFIKSGVQPRFFILRRYTGFRYASQEENIGIKQQDLQTLKAHTGQAGNINQVGYDTRVLVTLKSKSIHPLSRGQPVLTFSQLSYDNADRSQKKRKPQEESCHVGVSASQEDSDWRFELFKSLVIQDMKL